MALIVETGTGAANSESYVSVADCAAYAVNFGASFPTTDTTACEAALRRATSAIDNRYRPRFPGYRTNRFKQALEWPRSAAFYYTPQASDMPFGPLGGQGYGQGYRLYEYDQIDSNVIPPQVISACCEAAIRELAVPGTLAPDLDRGNAVAALKAGSVSITYDANAPRITVYHVLEQKLSALLEPPNPFSAHAVRV
jgi:hypothetical protein